jgi:hypothetical protein
MESIEAKDGSLTAKMVPSEKRGCTQIILAGVVEVSGMSRIGTEQWQGNTVTIDTKPKNTVATATVTTLDNVTKKVRFDIKNQEISIS